MVRDDGRHISPIITVVNNPSRSCFLSHLFECRSFCYLAVDVGGGVGGAADVVISHVLNASINLTHIKPKLHYRYLTLS